MALVATLNTTLIVLTGVVARPSALVTTGDGLIGLLVCLPTRRHNSPNLPAL